MIDLAELRVDLERVADDVASIPDSSPELDLEIVKVRTLLAIAQRLDAAMHPVRFSLGLDPEPPRSEKLAAAIRGDAPALKQAVRTINAGSATIESVGFFDVGDRVFRRPFGAGALVSFPDELTAAVLFDGQPEPTAVALSTLRHEGEPEPVAPEPEAIAHAAPRVGDTDPSGDFDLELPLSGSGGATVVNGDFEPGRITPAASADEAALDAFLNGDEESDDDRAE